MIQHICLAGMCECGFAYAVHTCGLISKQECISQMMHECLIALNPQPAHCLRLNPNVIMCFIPWQELWAAQPATFVTL